MHHCRPRGTLQLVKAGSGTELLSGTNSYTGGTQINGGALQLGNNSALGSNTAAVTVRRRPAGPQRIQPDDRRD